MSRVLTILVILGLMAVVALVPQMGEEACSAGPDLGDGYAYRQDTLARFRVLLEEGGWTLAGRGAAAGGIHLTAATA